MRETIGTEPGEIGMRLGTAAVETPVGPINRLVAPADSSVIDVTAAYAAALAADGEQAATEIAEATVPPDMVELLARGERGLAAAREAIEYARQAETERDPTGARLRHEPGTYRLLAPIPHPPSLRDYMAIEEHVANTMGDIPDVWYDMPVCYKGNPATVIPPTADVEWPVYSSVMDYELELAAVIGEGGSDLSPAEAADAIAGYTIFNDFSARDTQGREMNARLGPAKGKDFANGLGPYIVPATEFDIHEAELVARVDGEVWSRGTIDEMHHTFPEIVAHASQSEPLQPGAVIGSGTVGEGCGLELGRWLEDGSTVELSVAGIGTLEHSVVASAQ